MYERNVIVLERYFNKMFGYDMKNNLKTNFKDYSELVDCLEKYKNISEEEENIIQEYDSIANKIREIQKKQEGLNKKNTKYQEDRAEIFQNIDENPSLIQKKLDNVNANISNINEEIKNNGQQFVEVIADFTEKATIRTSCGKKRRNIENEYNKKLNETLDNYKDIDISIEKKAKQFIEANTENVENELKEKIMKNGEKEKIPFSSDVVAKAITLNVDIHKRELDVIVNIYEKTSKLFTEIKNNTIKTDKHNKIIKDSKCKLEFLGAMKEYLVQFLDNERLTAVNGEEEHSALMKEACKNLSEDLEQINNLYSLLVKEMVKKVNKKNYAELYNLDYLKALDVKAEQFDAEVKKLKLPVTIINPNYWRIEGMKKIYDVFYRCVTEEYGRDLTEYIVEEEPVKKEEEKEIIKEEEKEEEIIVPEVKETKAKKANKVESVKSQIDRKIDMILGIEKSEPEVKAVEEKKKTNGKGKKAKEIKEENAEEEWKNETEETWNDSELEDEEVWEDDEILEEDWEDEEELDEEWEDDEILDDEEDYTDEDETDNNEEDYDEENWEDDELLEEDWEDEEELDEEWEDDEILDEEDWDEDNISEDEEWEDDEELEEEDWEENPILENEEDKDEAYFDIWGNNIKKSSKLKSSSNSEAKKGRSSSKKSTAKKSEETPTDDEGYDDWENEFINIEKKSKSKKKKSFFDKFKK